MTRRPAGPRRGHTAPMQEIHAHVDIGAPPSVVWGVLADLGMYRRCNPLIRSVPGPAVSGSQPEIMVAAPPGPDTLLRLAIVQLRRGHGTTWLNGGRCPGHARRADASGSSRCRIEAFGFTTVSRFAGSWCRCSPAGVDRDEGPAAMQ